MTLSKYTPLCDAIVTLMNPLVEIVIHNIEDDKIVYINGSLSTRKVGDPSLLDQNSFNDLDQIIYPKINFNGKLIKSISVVLEDKWVLCINSDISLFTQMKSLSEVFLQNIGSDQPKSLFAKDWQEKLNVSIHEYLKKHHLAFDNLTLKNKKSVVEHLFHLGAFNEKNAADYIAKVLDLGRATVFKYLKEWRTK